MQKINKLDVNMPASLRKWKKQYPCGQYRDLENEANIRQDIRKACTTEQFFLCAYCCREISGENRDTHNEHVSSQNNCPNNSLDFNNIVASCNTKKQCGSAHGSQDLPLTPLMDECETELKFCLSGTVQGLTARAETMLRLLNLNNEKLIETRYNIISGLLYTEGFIEKPIYPTKVDDSKLVLVDDSELVLSVLEDMSKPNESGKLPAYFPAFANAIKNYYREKATQVL